YLQMQLLHLESLYYVLRRMYQRVAPTHKMAPLKSFAVTLAIPLLRHDRAAGASAISMLRLHVRTHDSVHNWHNIRIGMAHRTSGKYLETLLPDLLSFFVFVHQREYAHFAEERAPDVGGSLRPQTDRLVV